MIVETRRTLFREMACRKKTTGYELQGLVTCWLANPNEAELDLVPRDGVQDGLVRVVLNLRESLLLVPRRARI